VRLTTLFGASWLAFGQDDYRRARALALECVELGRASGEQRLVAFALTVLGFAASRTGDVEQALAYGEESLVLSRQLGDAETIASALFSYGNVLARTGSHDRAEAVWEESERLARAADLAFLLSLALNRLASVAVSRGNLDHAATICARALALIHQSGGFWSELPLLQVLVRVAQRRADVEQVVATAHQVGTRYRDLGELGGVSLMAIALAWVAHRRSDNLRAARLLGAADAIMAVSRRLRLPEDQQDYDSHVALVRAALGEEAFSAAWSEGRAMTLEQAIEYALRRDDGEPADAPPPTESAVTPPPAPRSATSTREPPLTPREADVARLIARGLTNRQIADALVISERTASSHVYRLLGKLGFSSRAQAAAWAVRHGLGETDA